MAGFFGSRPRALARSIGLLLVAMTGGTAGFAQSPAPPATQTSSGDEAPPLTPAATPAAADGAAPAAAPATSAAASKGAVTGYGYKASYSRSFSSESPPGHRHLLAHHSNEAVATFTGFEMLADGGSRVFVQLSRQVEVSPAAPEKPRSASSSSMSARRKGKKAHSTAGSPVVSALKFVLKGAEVLNPNNERALVTVHFNTPIVRSRLLPSGRDLNLLVELRADVAPQMKIVPAKDNGAMLQIDFAPGTYLPQGDADADDGAPDPPGAPAPAPLPTSSGSK